MSNLKRIIQIVDEIDLGDFPLDYNFFVTQDSYSDSITIMFALSTFQAYTELEPQGEMYTVSIGQFKEEYFYSDEEILKEINFLIKRSLAHEVDEFFLYKGERVFDPHAPGLIRLKATQPCRCI